MSGSHDNNCYIGSHDRAVMSDYARVMLFGNGADAAYAQNGGTVTVHGTKEYTSVSLTGGAILRGEHALSLYCTGDVNVAAGCKINCYLSPFAGGAVRIAAAAGDAGRGYGVNYHAMVSFSIAVGCGAGGGAGSAHVGGNCGGCMVINRWFLFQSHLIGAVAGGVAPNGDGNAGIANNATPAELAYFTRGNSPVFTLARPSGGGSGGLSNIGTGAVTASSGAGGLSGYSGGNLYIAALSISGAGDITVSGVAGGAGGDAVDATNADGNAGGGGGGGGGAGGKVAIYTPNLTLATANITAVGSAGGAGGTGVGGGGAGGAGTQGRDGIKEINEL